ncbi:Myb/SANT-like domain containing protein [Senna tora]|uniref:Myb/SANT-like domain containing protein n=1 Tax=Senna tora TaxID=362788 RepID=A0A834TYZ5_9FABA|nr:Myb/SANT-like domain containing protein [Senna tora]
MIDVLYLQSHSRAGPYRHKAFQHFDALTQLWGKDRATGGGAVSAHEARNNARTQNFEPHIDHNVPSGPHVGEDIEYFEGGGVKGGAEASSGSRKRKRCSSNKEEFKEVVREMTENMGKMFTTATRELVSSITFARNMSPDVVAEAVMFVNGLTIEECPVAHLKIACSPILWRMFNEFFETLDVEDPLMADRAKRHKGKNTTVRGSSSQEQLVDEFFTSEEQRQNYVTKFANRKVASSTEASGYMFGDHQSTLSKINGYDAQIVLKSLLAQPPEYMMDTTNFAASKFTFQNRLLHHIVQDCVTNKQGNHAYAKKMTRCSKTTSLSLSYASLISWILEKNGINPLTDEVESPSTIDINSLYNMRFTYDDHQWTEKPLTKAHKRILEQREREEAAEREREVTHAANGSSFQPPAEGPVNSEVLSAIQHLQCSVDEGFVQVNTRLNEFCTRIEALEVATIDNS